MRKDCRAGGGAAGAGPAPPRPAAPREARRGNPVPPEGARGFPEGPSGCQWDPSGRSKGPSGRQEGAPGCPGDPPDCREGPPAPLETPFFGEPSLSLASLEGLLLHLKGLGFSDLALSSGSPAAARVDGVWRRCSGRALHTGELAALLDAASGNAAASAIALGGSDLDFGFEVEESRASRLRFRANASGVASGWGTGLALTLRLVPGRPPSLEELGCEPGLARALFPANGLVVATGTMGSGKSTLLAAVLRRIVERGGRHVCTYEAPVEFDLAAVEGFHPPVEQSEIPRHMPDFRRAVRNLTRRAADCVLVGEARDPGTLRGVLEAAELGLCCYTTAHARSVSAVPRRILNSFAAGERGALAASLFSSLRCVVQQRLFPSPAGGRRAVREWLALDQPMRDALQAADPAGVPALLEGMVAERGMPLLRAVERDVSLGLLHASALAAVRAEKGAGT